MAGKGDTRRPESVADKVGCDRGHAMPDKWGRCWRCGERVQWQLKYQGVSSMVFPIDQTASALD